MTNKIPEIPPYISSAPIGLRYHNLKTNTTGEISPRGVAICGLIILATILAVMENL